MPVAARKRLAEKSTCLSLARTEEKYHEQWFQQKTPPRDVIYDRCVCMYAKKVMSLPAVLRRAGFKPGELQWRNVAVKGRECTAGRRIWYISYFNQHGHQARPQPMKISRVWIAGNGKNYFNSQDDMKTCENRPATRQINLYWKTPTLERILQLPL